MQNRTNSLIWLTYDLRTHIHNKLFKLNKIENAKEYKSDKAQSNIINTFGLLDFAKFKRHGRIDLTIVFQLL